jgi:two-component system, NtrC family, response regulator HydG
MISRFGRLVSSVPAMLKIFEELEVVSTTGSAVLVLGESGTGKELLARAIHEKSKRADKQFLAVNSSAGNRELIDSELFGHVKGSFTGATYDRKGYFESASGGTLFLDEIGDMPLETQAKILRALETREVQPVGSNKTVKFDVRVIAATNKNLEEEIAFGRFREDLFFRINDFVVKIPALRERMVDIHLLFKDMIDEFNAEFGRNVRSLTIAALGILQTHRWPGNIRELRNVIRRAMMFINHSRTEILAEDLFGNICLNGSADRASAGVFGGAGNRDDGRDDNRCVSTHSLSAPRVLPEGSSEMLSLEEYMNAREKEYIENILEMAADNKSKAARMLGIDRTTLYEKIKKFKIRRLEKSSL